MNKIIGVTDLQRNFRAVFDEVVHSNVPFILTRGSRPEAVLVPYEAYLRYAQIDETEAIDRFEKLRARMALANARHPEDEVDKDLRRARRTVRSRDKG